MKHLIQSAKDDIQIDLTTAKQLWLFRVMGTKKRTCKRGWDGQVLLLRGGSASAPSRKKRISPLEGKYVFQWWRRRIGFSLSERRRERSSVIPWMRWAYIWFVKNGPTQEIRIEKSKKSVKFIRSWYNTITGLTSGKERVKYLKYSSSVIVSTCRYPWGNLFEIFCWKIL